MPDTARPFPFYQTAWLTDKDLTPCSMKARAMLIQLIVLSATGHIFGYVTDSKGVGLSVQEISETMGAAILRGTVTKEEVMSGIKELVEHTRIGYDKRFKAYYIPKMVRIGKNRKDSSAYGHRGGSPVLIEAKRKKEWDMAVQLTVDKLWRIEQSQGPKSEDFAIAMSQYGKEFRHLGKGQDGKSDVVAEAMEVIQYRRGTHK